MLQKCSSLWMDIRLFPEKSGDFPLPKVGTWYACYNLQKRIGRHRIHPIDSDLGHMAGILEAFRFDARVKDFLSRL